MRVSDGSSDVCSADLSSFVLNGINSILAFDSNQLHVPGDELDEIVIPESMLWLSMGVAKNVSMEAFYQFDAPRTQPDAAGTFWATNDFAAVGGTRADPSLDRKSTRLTSSH